ncbi:prephenate dehydratase [Aliidiomarina maris]|uniref:prephenate dehydratase n=1 Tax=Aliidiomarina maris TaxID=531312 RepID=A0A327WWW2_9GAMM|nr:prephenate dehydratase domain-containing protein [Aliidiomarina maris]RAJ96970.1 prephenate dehydratase [Aliidiomarina maris]RUO24581.1 prephenate dehydratase [Aliidiomarina maris]
MQVATLGPSGTFSEQAALGLFAPAQGHQLQLHSHLQRCLLALPAQADVAVVPIENVSEGFVPVVLDYLVTADVHIAQEMSLPIAFSVCAHGDNIERLYVQFVARGQCRDYIDSLGDIEIVPTQSNTESLALATEYGQGAGAIIPSHLDQQLPASMHCLRTDVQDYSHNQTRFVVLKAGPTPRDAVGNKTSIMVINDDDRPGLLEKVLHCFSTRRLNLTSIVSRPTGQGFGRYHFFIDVAVEVENIAMQGALKGVSQIARVKVLGCY